jgi:hypothetical protein
MEKISDSRTAEMKKHFGQLYSRDEKTFQTAA